MYSLAKGKIQFPKLNGVKTATTTGEILKGKKVLEYPGGDENFFAPEIVRNLEAEGNGFQVAKNSRNVLDVARSAQNQPLCAGPQRGLDGA